MLDKPDLDDHLLTGRLREAYGLDTSQLTFLPLGADANTAVYRAVTADGGAYFVKLRRGAFDELSVRLPRYLSEHGVPHLIPVVETIAGALWAALEPYTVIVYPFIAGRDGYEASLTAQQWFDLGAALKRLHTASLPPEMLGRLQRETFGGGARAQVRAFLYGLSTAEPTDAVATELVAFMQEKRAQVADLANRAERCAEYLKAHPPEFVVCHGDLHAGNVLLSDGGFYLVDWDAPILAPKERDLMVPGGAQGFLDHTPDEEARLFLNGYGPVQLNLVALAYYRLERIVQDVAIFCDEISRGVSSEREREQSLRYLTANFRPGGTVERAYAVETPSGG